MTDEQELHPAIKVADRILKAVIVKFPQYVGYTRRYTSGEKGFVEIMIKPAGQSNARQEVTTAYSDEYFTSATKENINDKAKRVLGDIKLLISAR